MQVSSSPEDHGRTPWSALPNALSVVGGVAGLVTLFFPNLRDWMEKNGLAGWVSLFVALIVIPSLALTYLGHHLEKVRQEAQAVTRAEIASSIDSRIEDARMKARAQAEAQAARRYTSRDKDVALIEERLGEWTLQSFFFEYLVENANHGHYLSEISQDITNHVYQWDRDDRQISDSRLRTAWDSVREATTRYSQSLHEHMWAEDDGERGPSSTEFVRVPIEWKTKYPERSKKAYAELDTTRLNLITSLRTMFKELHSAKPMSNSTVEATAIASSSTSLRRSRPARQR